MLDPRNHRSINVEWRDEMGMTALHLAVGAGHLSCTERLLKAGAQVDACTKENVTPLMLAANDGDVQAFDMLKSRGASLTSPDIHGHTALFHAVYNRRHGFVEHMLRVARRLPHVDVPLLLNTEDVLGLSPLYFALENWDLRMGT